MIKKALVIGFGVSGRSAAKFLLGQSWQVAAVDRNAHDLILHPEVQSFMDLGVPILKDDVDLPLSQFQLAILSPGINPTHLLVRALQESGIECIGEAELAFRFLHLPAIGITGTNGKTTVTLLVQHILEANNVCSKALGNVGTPLAEEIPYLSKNCVVVAELSSFQLETITRKILDHAVILNITPDHLDRYGTMENYAQAKISIGKLLKGANKLLVFEEVYWEFSQIFDKMEVDLYGYSPDCFYWTDLNALYKKTDKLCDLPDPLKGRKGHDLENFIAAFALCLSHGILPEKIVEGWSSFNKPHHRIEYLGEKAGIAYYDDSKGTNIDAVIRAVETMTRPTILIAGGVHKGASYAPWVKSFSGKVKKIFAIGEAAPLIKEELEDLISVTCCISMKEAVEQAARACNPGDAILLSPGCSSFDMFRDYAHRGDEFAKCVKELGNEIEAKV